MMERFTAVVLVLILMLTALAPSALAKPSEAGCEKSPTGKHSWGARPRNAWCDYAGGYVWSCGYCGKHVFEETTPALGHDWPAWTQTKAATCKEKGSRTRTCKRCHKVETQAIAALGHYFPNPWTTVKEPTCEEAGQEVNYCARCGYEWRRELEAIGHDWDEGVVTKEPTEYEEGEMTYTCKNDPSHTKTEPIDKKDTTSYTIKIIWNDNNNAAGLRPEQTTVIFRGHEYVSDFEFCEYITLSDENGWTYTFSDLPVVDYAGYQAYDIVYEWKYGKCPAGYNRKLTGEYYHTEVCTYTLITDTPDLLLVKNVANHPKDLEYFHEGEQVEWGLTAANTSEDPITEVTVDDKGTTVGSFDSVEPGESLPCEVPSETVTEYEAKVVGYITNYATAAGKDTVGGEHFWPSNVATAPTKKLTDEDDPLGPVYGLKVAASITKEEAHDPLNGKYYELNETIDYVITVKNTGEETLKDVEIIDSLNGDTPIGTLDSLAPGEKKEFTFSYTVTQDDIDHHWVVNMALLTYTFGKNIGGTPRSSDKVYSKAGEGDGPVEHFDPDKLPKDAEYCSLTLDALSDNEARYTLHSCAGHLTTLSDAEVSAAEGDWDEAAEIWYSAILEMYAILYEAGDSEAKAAVTEECALFTAYMEKYAAAVNTQEVKDMREETEKLYGLFLSTAKDENRKNELIAERDILFREIDTYGETITGEALVRMLRLKCALLCYSVSTLPEQQLSSLTGAYETLEGTEARETSIREFGELNGSDCAVTEYYDTPAARALKDVRSLLTETGYGSLESIFLRGQSFWQAALDEEVKPLYLEADETRKQDIGAWRVTLDSLLPGARGLLALMYPEAPEIPEELLMDLYRDANFFVENMR